MRASTRGAIVAACYLAVVGLAIAYELDIRIHDTAHSEFAGWLSIVLTLPTGVLLNALSRAVFGVVIGDSNRSFVAILGLAALINAAVLYLGVSRLQPPSRR